MQLDPTAAKAGVKLAVHDAIGSTNAEALRLARGGERGPLWVVARRQSAGRGRRDNAWVSERGNLYATLLLTAPAPPARAPELSFVAGLAVLAAIEDAAPALRGRLRLKWPNDILIDEGKAAGILIEAEDDRFAVGIGVNCVSHPDGTAFPATDLAHAGAMLSAEDVFSALSAAMLRLLAQWSGGAGFAALRTAWLDRAYGLGGEIRVRLPDRDLTGRFEGLDADGRLLLAMQNGVTETVSAGTVFGLMPPTAAGRR